MAADLITRAIDAGRRALGALVALVGCAGLIVGACAAPAAALCGDLTGDGHVRSSDALRALQLAIGRDYEARGDVASAAPPDGLVSSTDALVILQSATSADVPSCAAATATRVAAVTASIDFATGGIAEIALADFRVLRHQLGFAAGDSVIRASDDRVFVLNRFASNNVQELDHDSLDTLSQCSVGTGANPHDLTAIAEDRGYVTLYDKPGLAVVDLSSGPGCGGFVAGHVDLTPWSDDDGVPEMDQSVMVGERLFVALQLLERTSFFVPTGPGRLAVVDTTTDTVTTAIDLAIENPFAETKGLVYHAASDRIYVGGPGNLFTDLDDGGIEIVDPVGLRSEGIVITGAELGGDLTDFVLVGTERAYALVADARFEVSLVEVDLGTRQVVATLASSEFLISDIELDESGTLCMADRDPLRPGLRCFDIADNSELTDEPVYPGLTPFNLVFLR